MIVFAEAIIVLLAVAASLAAIATFAYLLWLIGLEVIEHRAAAAGRRPAPPSGPPRLHIVR